MLPRIHMQDQVHDRIKDIMGEKVRFKLENVMQNLITLMIIIVFLMLGLNW